MAETGDEDWQWRSAELVITDMTMGKQEHRVSVDNGRYEFTARPGNLTVSILRNGEPFEAHSDAIHAMMCELDAARAVVQDVRRYVAGEVAGADAYFTEILALHDSLTSDREPPSAWCGAEHANGEVDP